MQQTLVGNLFIRLGERIKSGDFCLSDEEMIEVMKMVAHEKWYIAKVCRELKCTQRTLERWIADGLMPPFRKEFGGKKYYYADEIIPYRQKLNR